MLKAICNLGKNKIYGFHLILNVVKKKSIKKAIWGNSMGQTTGGRKKKEKKESVDKYKKYNKTKTH